MAKAQQRLAPVWRRFDGCKCAAEHGLDTLLVFERSVRSLRTTHAPLQGYTSQQLVYRTAGPGTLSHLFTAPALRAAFRLDIAA